MTLKMTLKEPEADHQLRMEDKEDAIQHITGLMLYTVVAGLTVVAFFMTLY